MPQTFEEVVAQELDSLYAGSIFLTSGDENRAEQLLREMLLEASREWREWEPVEEPARWLEGRLVKCFLGSRTRLAGPVHAVLGPGARASRRESDEPDVRALCRAAAAVSPLPRAVVWLMTLRRWRYEDAASVVRLDRGRVGELLQERERLVAAFARERGRRRSDRSVS